MPLSSCGYFSVQGIDGQSGSVSDVSEDVLDSLEDEDESKRNVVDGQNSGTADIGNSSSVDALDGLSETEVPGNSAAGKSPSFVKDLVSELESRYSTAASTPSQPPPALQSCPKISALQDTLIWKVQDQNAPRAAPALDNSPSVSSIRNNLVSRTRVPEPEKISTPTLQSCPKITALRETLIARVQDPRTALSSMVVGRDLVNCPSVTLRQNALLDAAAKSSKERSATGSLSPRRRASFGLPANGEEDALPNSRDGPKKEWARVRRSNSGDVSRGGAVGPADEKTPGRWDGLKVESVEDGLTNTREVPESGSHNLQDVLDHRSSNGGSVLEDVPLEERSRRPGYGDRPENELGSIRDVPNTNSGPAHSVPQSRPDSDTVSEGEQLLREQTVQCDTDG